MILLEFRCSSRVLKGRRGGCCLQEPRGGEECLLDTGRKAAFVRRGPVKSSDPVVCGFVAKRGCLGLDRIPHYILERKKIPESERNQDLLLFKALSPESK